MKLIQGKDVMIYEVDGATDKPIVCAKSCTITKSFEVIETTHYSSTSKEFTTGMSEWDISLDGIVTLDTDTTNKGIFDFFDGAKKSIKAEFTDGTNTKTLTGDVIPPSVSLTGDVSDFSGYSLTLKGTGDLTLA